MIRFDFSAFSDWPRFRRYCLLTALLSQAALFWIFMPVPPAVVNDNARYEVAGYNLASGNSLSLPKAMSNDAEMERAACARNPAYCGSELVPTAMYPVGYQLHIALVYLLGGQRNLWAIVVSQLLLLLLMIVVFERQLAVTTGRVGYVFGMAVASSYPFLARQAGLVVNDVSHAAMFVFGLAAGELMRPGPLRGATCGIFVSLATLVRPHSLVCMPFIAFAFVMRRPRAARAELLALLLGLAIPLSLWTIRNAVVFGKFIPIVASGRGGLAYMNKLEWTIGSPLISKNFSAMNTIMEEIAGGHDFMSLEGHRRLNAAAWEWTRSHPLEMGILMLKRIPRAWISMGVQGEGLSRFWALSVGYLGGLLLLGCWGLWIRRHDRGAWLMGGAILAYWAFLIPVPIEARRTLALRLPMLVFASVAFESLLTRPHMSPLLAKQEAGAPKA